MTSHRPVLRLPVLVLAVATAVVAGSAARATTVKTKPPASAASQAQPRAYATRDQLRDCMDTEDALKIKRTALETAQAEHEKQLNTLESENAKIVEVQGQLDRDSDTAIQAFNLLVSDHNVHVKQVNEEGARERADASSYNEGALALNRKCATLVYRVDDMDVVMKERRAAGK